MEDEPRLNYNQILDIIGPVAYNSQTDDYYIDKFRSYVNNLENGTPQNNVVAVMNGLYDQQEVSYQYVRDRARQEAIRNNLDFNLPETVDELLDPAIYPFDNAEEILRIANPLLSRLIELMNEVMFEDPASEDPDDLSQGSEGTGFPENPSFGAGGGKKVRKFKKPTKKYVKSKKPTKKYKKSTKKYKKPTKKYVKSKKNY